MKKCIPYINCIILIEGVMNRTIHNIFVCVYINRVLSMIKVSVLGGGLVVCEELNNNG